MMNLRMNIKKTKITGQSKITLVNNGYSQVEAHNLTIEIYNYTEGCNKYESLTKKFQKK